MSNKKREISIEEKMERMKNLKKQKTSKITTKDVETYISNFQTFINLEYEEEKRQLDEQLTSYSNQRLIDEGMTLFNLKGTTDGHFFSNMIIKFSHFNFDKLPNHHFNSGDMISLSINHPMKDKLFNGTILNFNQKSIRVLLNIEHWSHKSTLFRIDKSMNQTTLLKMSEALTAIQFRPDERNIENSHLPIGSYLSNILLGDTDLMSSSFLFEPNDTFIQNWKQSVKGRINEAQTNAILKSMSQQISLIHGPPGTGKTTTLVQMIKLYISINPVNILVTAFTNVAVDNLLEGLLNEGISVLRIGQPTKTNERLLSSTLEFKIEEHENYKQIQEMKAKMIKLFDLSKIYIKYRSQIETLKKDIQKLKEETIKDILKNTNIICSTCVSSDVDLLQGIEFPFVVVDECCQSLEPGCLIPIMKGSKQIVLAGDPNQLEPTILVQESIKKGFSKSLFSRLMELGLPTFLLNVQYRMHPKICEFPSQEFYQGKLLSDKKCEFSERIFYCFKWPNKKIPIMFINVKSKELDVDNSKINKLQMEIVIDVFDEISKAFSRKDIGIISPYKSQVKAIKKVLNNEEIEIKSVDGFQGREKKFIIFSTVRSNNRGNVGFLSDWKRLNVAITRCKYGLVIIGDEQTLKYDKTWRDYLKWLNSNGLIVEY
eukprot:gene1754-523_t